MSEFSHIVVAVILAGIAVGAFSIVENPEWVAEPLYEVFYDIEAYTGGTDIRWDDYSVTICPMTNNSDIVIEAVDIWNKNSNAKISVINTTDADMIIYTCNRSELTTIADGMFGGYIQDTNVLGCTNIDDKKMKVIIWLSDELNQEHERNLHATLHEISHGMGIPHLSPYGGVMGAAFYDFDKKPFCDNTFNEEELEYIRMVYP